MSFDVVHFAPDGLPVCGASALFGGSGSRERVTCDRCLRLVELGPAAPWSVMHFRRHEGTGLAAATACGVQLVYPSKDATVFPWSVTCRACLESMTEAEVADGGRFVGVRGVDSVKVAAWLPLSEEVSRELRPELVEAAAPGVADACRGLGRAFVELVEAVTVAVGDLCSSVWRPMSRYERVRSLVIFGFGVVLAGGVVVLLEVRS